MRQAAIAIIRHPETEGLYLGVTRGKSDKIGLPGGKVELNEDDFSAVVREVKEEVNLDIVNGILIHQGVVLSHEANDYWTHKDTEVSVYLCGVDTFETLRGSDEGEPIWSSEEDFMKNAFAKFNKEAFAALNSFLQNYGQ
jgi:8-oxo-dGTP pyrophosphatase MutT (NUDIX family)